MSSFFYSLYIFDITHWWMWSWWKYFIILSMAILSPWRCPLSSRWFSIPFIIWWSYHLHYWSYFQDVVSCVNGYSPLSLLSCSVYLVWCWHLWSTWTWVVFRVLCLPGKVFAHTCGDTLFMIYKSLPGDSENNMRLKLQRSYSGNWHF